MVILALETATRAGSVAIWDGGALAARRGEASRTHVERLPDELIAWAREHGRTLQDIDLCAVISGPGSFTGLRVGIAAIQGLALAAGCGVVAVPTLEAIATAWLGAHRAAPLVVPCIDGQRGDVFVAAFAAGPDGGGDEMVALLEPCVATPEDAARLVAACIAARPGAIVGDGAARYSEIFHAALPHLVLADTLVPLAGIAAELAARHPDRAVAPHALRPIYLRRPDAELARERARATTGPSFADFTVRRVASDDDLAGVERLQQLTFTNPWGAEAIRWELEHTDVARLYVMSAPDGTLVAYCACWIIFDELHINSLAVDTVWRRRGVARHLLSQILRETGRDGARSATLEVRASNSAARGLYEGMGFKVEGVRKDYYQDPREDALILWKRS